MPTRNRHRLPADAYKVPGSAWHITIRTPERLDPPFTDIDLGRHMLRFLEKGFHERDSVPHLLCLMPDHLHVLVEIRSVGLEDLIARIKSFSTQIWWGRGGSGTLWQKSFYDHGIRGFDDFDSTVTYILNNPVEAGLASHWEEYPLFVGTLVNPETQTS
jgi:REP element-mobilizing transposase RayT